MYNAFWRHALFVRGQSFSVKTFDRSRNGCQVIGEGAGNDFRGPSVQALPLPSRVSFSRARFFLVPTTSVSPSLGRVFSCAHYFQVPATQARTGSTSTSLQTILSISASKSRSSLWRWIMKPPRWHFHFVIHAKLNNACVERGCVRYFPVVP